MHDTLFPLVLWQGEVLGSDGIAIVNGRWHKGQDRGWLYKFLYFPDLRSTQLKKSALCTILSDPPIH